MVFVARSRSIAGMVANCVGPYLTAEYPPVPARTRQQPEDFFVQELPAYEPADTGTHCYVQIEKRGLSTMEAVRTLANSLGVQPRQVGYAGLKDATAVLREIIQGPEFGAALPTQGP